ncbi:MAG: ABC transporter permease [Luteibacter jiangsuensis]
MKRSPEVSRDAPALARWPAFMLLASGTLSLGIAAAICGVTLLDAVLQPPPWPNHERVAIYGRRTPDDPMRAMSPPLYDAVGQPAMVLSRGIASIPETVNVVAGRHSEILRAQRVDSGFLRTLGVVPSGIAEGGMGHGALVSESLRDRLADIAPRVVGQTIVVDGSNVQVRGVLPADYRFFSDVDLLLPLDPSNGSTALAGNMTAVALLSSASDIRPFSAHVLRAARAIGTDPHGEDVRWSGATPIDDLVAYRARVPLWGFALSGVLVLAVAGMNVSQLISTRMFGRIDGTAVKMVFGARWEPWRSAGFDALAVGVLAFAMGLPGGTALVRLFEPLIPPAWLVSAIPVEPGWRVLSLVAAMTLVMLVLATVVGATRVMGRLRHRERTMMSGAPAMRAATGWAAPALALAQVALATLLVSYGLIAVSRAWLLAGTSPGFDAVGGVAVQLHPSMRAYPEWRDVVRLADTIRSSISALPGVEAVGWSTDVPTGRGFRMPFLRSDGSSQFIAFAAVSPGGNEAMGLRLLAGRTIGDSDGSDAHRVALVNEAYVHAFGSRGIGGVVRPAGRDVPDARIVGIVGNTRRDTSGVAAPVVYVPLAQVDPRVFALMRQLQPLFVAIRGQAAATVANDALPSIVGGAAPSLALSPPVSLERIADAPLAGARRDVALFATLSGFAVSLTAAGQYAMHSVEVAASRYALSLRMALGATPGQLFAHVVRKAFRVTLGGIVLGLFGTCVMQHFSLGMAMPAGTAIGVSTAAALVMVLGTLVAVAAPASHAAALEPWRVLRSD